MGVWMRALLFAVISICLCGLVSGLAAQPRTLSLYLDAEFQEHEPGARAIEVGLLAALHAARDRLPAHLTLQILRMDHRGNVKRSHRHMRDYLNDGSALAMIGGLHSAPYLAYREFVNDNRILLLLPWSAAGPLTRSAGAENWIFRLSVDDSKAGQRMVEHAIGSKGCARPALWLWDAGWGHSNEDTMRRALREHGIADPLVFYFSGNLIESHARIEALELAGSGADCALLVANAADGAKLVNALAATGDQVSIISHWGLTGGRFHLRTTPVARQAVALEVLQTCYAYQPDHPSMVYARHAFPNDFDAEGRILAPSGFFHGHDLGLILIEALRDAPEGATITVLRAHVHHRLQSGDITVDGFLRGYDRPFRSYTPDDRDAHEALGAGDLCFSSYDAAGRLRPPQ